MTNVLIVEDDPFSVEILSGYVAAAPDRYRLAHVIPNAANAELVCFAKPVDLILMDVCTADCASGLDAAAKIKKSLPRIRVVIITSAPEYRFLEKARQAGADSFWYKEAGREELLDLLDRTMAGESIYPDRTPPVPMGDASSADLTPRELETLYWLVREGSLKRIAQAMGIEVGTVKTNLTNLKNKTGCRTKAELAILATERRLVLPKY